MTVAKLFNDMADDYDDLRDLWYAWLFSRLHYIIAREIITKESPEAVLDIGCGTGFQTYLHAAGGATATGIDIATDLVRVAGQKEAKFDPRKSIQLFPSWFNFVDRYNNKIQNLLEGKSKIDNYNPPSFGVADAIELPFKRESFDHINCCGSTLSFIKNHGQALSEMSRVLKPRGSILIEVEARWNIDLLWGLVDPFIFGKLGYENSVKDGIGGFTVRPCSFITTDYPFGEPGQSVNMTIKLFTATGLIDELKKAGIVVTRKLSIHSVTNIIPSTFLDSSKPSTMLKKIFGFLAKIEETSPLYFPGCSLVLIGRKQ